MTIGKRKSMGASIVLGLLLSLFLLLFSVFNMSDFHDPSSEFGSSFSSNPPFFSLNLTLHNHHLLNSFQALFTRCSISCLFSFACFFFFLYLYPQSNKPTIIKIKQWHRQVRILLWLNLALSISSFKKSQLVCFICT